MALLALLGLADEFTITAQEALRASLAGQTAMEMKKQKVAAGWGDIRLGPVRLDLSTQVDVEASDNVRYEQTGTDSDVIFRPSFGVRAVYPLTEKNLLSLGAGVGYNWYLDNDDLNYAFITPDSDLAFDIYVGDFVINFHDRFHFTQDITDQPSVSGRGSYGRFDNSLGALIIWDLNKAQVALNYDHYTYLVTEEDYEYTDHASELFSLRSAWLTTPTTPLGIEAGFGTTDYDQNVLNDMIHYSAGVFYEMPSGRLSRLRLAGGYVWYDPTENNSTNTSGGEMMDAVYADLTFHHRLNPQLSYMLTAGQQMETGVYAETLRLLYVRTTFNLNVIHDFSLGMSLGYENGEESGGVSDPEQFDRFLAGATIGKRLNDKLRASLAYLFLYRDSDQPDRSYSQNRLVLNLTYTF